MERILVAPRPRPLRAGNVHERGGAGVSSLPRRVAVHRSVAARGHAIHVGVGGRWRLRGGGGSMARIGVVLFHLAVLVVLTSSVCWGYGGTGAEDHCEKRAGKRALGTFVFRVLLQKWNQHSRMDRGRE